MANKKMSVFVTPDNKSYDIDAKFLGGKLPSDYTLAEDFTAHINNKENPHGVTAAQVGLGNVNNTSDADKPISTAAQTALDNKLSLSGGTMTGPITLKDADGQGILFGGKNSNINIVDNGTTKTLVGFWDNAFTLGHGSFNTKIRADNFTLASNYTELTSGGSLKFNAGGDVIFNCPGNADLVISGVSTNTDYVALKAGSPGRALFIQPNQHGCVNIGGTPSTTGKQDLSARLIVDGDIKANGHKVATENQVILNNVENLCERGFRLSSVDIPLSEAETATEVVMTTIDDGSFYVQHRRLTPENHLDTSIAITNYDNRDGLAIVKSSDNGLFTYSLPDGSGEFTLSAIEIAYEDLKFKRDKSQLVKGQWYRITDYTGVDNNLAKGVKNANHPFDIIVFASEVNKLNENAFAAHHKGDLYFKDCNLEAWQLWYTLDFDQNRFSNAFSNGLSGSKGFIYRMIDEKNNDICYDFKNVLWKRSKEWLTDPIRKTYITQSITTTPITSDLYFYTFSSYTPELEEDNTSNNNIIIKNSFNIIIISGYNDIEIDSCQNLWLDDADGIFSHSNNLCLSGNPIANLKAFEFNNSDIIGPYFYNVKLSSVSNFNIIENDTSSSIINFVAEQTDFENIKLEIPPETETIDNVHIYPGLSGGTPELPKVIQIPEHGDTLLEIKPKDTIEYINPTPDINYYYDDSLAPEDQNKPFQGFTGTTEELFNILAEGGTEHKWTDMTCMFDSCDLIETIPNIDTKNVRIMNSFCSYSASLTTIPLLDTSNVTEMDTMFAGCTSLKTIPLLDTSKVTNMYNMFYACSSLTTIPQLDTSKVTDMREMFYNCPELTSIPQLNTSKVTNMYGMFAGCYSLTSIPQLDTSNVTNMSGMFSGCISLKTIPQLDTSKVTSVYSMFAGCTSLKTIPLLDTSKVIDMSGMFSRCTSLTTIPQLDTSKVTDMREMFYNCPELTSIPQLNTSKVTDMIWMFADCTSLKEIHMKNINATLSIDDTILEHDALVELIGNLMPQSNPQTPSKTLTLGPTLKAKLSEAEIKVAIDKGWTVA